jgi:polar amino acid transport system substrate-binding protein
MSRTTRARAATALVSIASVAVLLTGCAGLRCPRVHRRLRLRPAHEGLTTFTPGTLTVGVPENLPYTQTKGSDASGLEIDVVRKLAEAECLALAFVPITYANGIPMISEQKKTDMITGGWYVTAARAEKVGFTSPTFYDSMGIISKDGIDTVTGLESVGAVGSGAGFVGGRHVRHPRRQVQDLPGHGRDEAGPPQRPDPGGPRRVRRRDRRLQGHGLQVKPAQEDDRVAITTAQPMIAFPIDKDNTALADAFSALIDGFRADGTLAELNASYDLPDSSSSPPTKRDLHPLIRPWWSAGRPHHLER